jgi:hypothetical protein
MRIPVLLATVAAGVLALGAPAAAKGVNGVTIDGDGLAAPIVHDLAAPNGRDLAGPGLYAVAEDTGVHAVIWSGGTDGLVPDVPAGDLGPQLVLTWRLPTSATHVALIEQEVYPYADGGPVVHTRAGQPTYPGDHTAGGWLHAPDSLVTALQRLGVPTRAALEAALAEQLAAAQAARSAAAAPDLHTARTDDPSRWPLVAIVGVASLVLLLPGVRPLTRRRAIVT